MANVLRVTEDAFKVSTEVLNGAAARFGQVHGH
jgi:hypothetical protein